MIDFSEIKFIVDRIEYDGNNNACKNYVMKPTPDIRCKCSVLTDEKGNRYQPLCSSRRTVSNENEPKLVEYWFEFDDDDDPNFEMGTVLIPDPPKWKKEIPNSKLIKVTHSAEGIDFNTGKTFEKLEISVDIEGRVSVLRGKSEYLAEDRTATFNVAENRAEKLLADMLRCVAGTDCYDNMYYDDTARRITYEFENGQSVSFGGTFAHGEYDVDYEDTAQVIGTFWSEVSGTNVYRTTYSGKTIQEKCERIGSDIGEKIERVVKRYNR